MSKVYEWVADRLISIIESNEELPWRKPWKERNMACNWLTQKSYRGINRLTTVPGGEYATEYQIKQHGGSIKPEEKKKYTMVVYWLWPNKKASEDDEEYEEDNEDGGRKKRPTPLYSKVWEINTQCIGLSSRRPPLDQISQQNPIEAAEAIIQGYLKNPQGPKFKHVPGTADYVIPLDMVRVPPKEDYSQIESYYSVAFHELIHSTGSQSRLARPGIVYFDKFGSQQYSKEELVAEIGASILCWEAEISQVTEEDHAAYVKSWLRVLKNDKTMIVMAAQQAEKSVNLVLGRTKEQKEENAA